LAVFAFSSLIAEIKKIAVLLNAETIGRDRRGLLIGHYTLQHWEEGRFSSSVGEQAHETLRGEAKFAETLRTVNRR
jgi:hypothetical protein